jgi:hypothetical protein
MNTSFERLAAGPDRQAGLQIEGDPAGLIIASHQGDS